MIMKPMNPAAGRAPLTPFSRRQRLDLDVDTTFSEETTPSAKGASASSRNPFGRAVQTCVKGPATFAREPATTLKKRLPKADSVGGGDAVKVFIRVKPTLAEDLKLGRNEEALRIVEKNNKRTITLPANAGKENWFASEDYDGIFDDDTNQHVYESVASGLLPHFLSGINVSIMAYGQTGSGKTYTMFGSNEPGAQVHGLLHLALHSVEGQVCLGSPSARLLVSVVEVYNEELIVLLDGAGVERRPLTKGMSEYHATKGLSVDDADRAIELVTEALKLRAQDATVRNATSSRSHAIVKLQLLQPFAVSTLLLVDLAGSESIVQASSNAQQRETIHINTSLHALECVFNSMATRQPHLPFRNSKLTEALQEGIDPHKARVALVATVSRFYPDVAVTKSTLMFAMRALNVRTFAQVNPAPKRAAQQCPEELHRQLQDLQAINNKLRQQLADLEGNHERSTRERQVELMREELRRLAELHTQLRRTGERQAAEAEGALEELRAALEAERCGHGAARERVEELQLFRGVLQAAAEAEKDKAEREREVAWAARVEAEAARAEAGAAREEAAAAGRGVAAVRAALVEAQAEAARAGGELAGAWAMVEKLQQQLTEALEALLLAKQQVTTLKGQLAAAGAGAGELQQLEQQLAAQGAEARAAAGRLAQAEQQLAAQQTEAAAAAERVELLEEQLAARQANAMSAAERLDALEQDLAAQRAEATSAAGRAEQAEQELAAQRAEATSATGRAAEAEQQLAAHRSEADAVLVALTAEAQALEERQLGTQQALAEVQLLNTLQAQELAEAGAHAAGLQQRLNEAERAAAERDAELRRRADDAAQRAEEQARELSSALARAAQEEGRVRELEAEAAELEARLAKAQTEAEEQAVAGAGLRAQLAAVQEAAAVAAAAAAAAQVAAAEELRAQLAAAQGAAAELRAQLADAAAAEGQSLEGLQAEAAGLRQLLADKAAALGRQAATASVALASAVQEARTAAESVAEQRLVPLRTEAERLRATCSLQEQQLARLQAEGERQRCAAEEGAAAGVRLAAECAAARQERDEARRGAAEAGERAARLEAQMDAPRREARSGLEERVRQLEAQLKRAEGDARGELELKDKLIHKLRLDVQQQQNELERLRQDTAVAPGSDQQGAGSPYIAAGRAGSTSPGDEGTPGPHGHGHGPARGPSSGGGYMMLGRTTTQGAAALRRNNAAKPLVDLVTPPRPGPAAAPPVDLITPADAATPREGEDPSSCERASPHEDLLAAVRGPVRRPVSYGGGARNQMNY